MAKTVTSLAELLRSLHPVLNPGVYAFASVAADTDVSAWAPIATFREAEGLTVIIEEQHARRLGLPVLFRSAWLTLTLHSDLQAVGLTAAVATALARADIGCNVVAAARHDHLFVPIECADEALAILQALQQRSGPGFVPSKA